MSLFISTGKNLLKFLIVPRILHSVDVSFRTFPFSLHPQLLLRFSGSFSLMVCMFVFSLQLLNRKDKTTFEKLDYLMSKEDNYKRTREYIRSLKMVPSIPYLGRSLNWILIF